MIFKKKYNKYDYDIIICLLDLMNLYLRVLSYRLSHSKSYSKQSLIKMYPVLKQKL